MELKFPKKKKPKVKRSKYEFKTDDNIERNAVRNFQKYIRLRDTDHNGNGYCITCGQPIRWNNCDAGHLIKRRHKATLFDEKNCNAQCVYCNQHLSGNDAVYRDKIDFKWGEGTYRDLVNKKNEIVKRGKPQFIALNEYYLKKCRELKKPL